LHPVLFRLPLPWGGHFDIATYGVMMALGALAGILVAWRLGKRDGVAAEVVIDVGFWGVFGGITGAKVWYVIQYWGQYGDKWELVKGCRSGLVWYGGVLGGTAAIIGYLLYKRLKVLKVLDACATGSALGLAFGRIGCFSNGCCYGEVTDSALGVCFKNTSPAFADQLNRGLVTAADAVSLPAYPTQLFEAVGSLLVFALLVVLRRWRRFYGEQVAWLFMLYPALRFTIEFYRGDHARSFAGLTAAQVFSIAAFAAALAALFYLRTARPRRLGVNGETSSN